MRRVLNVVWKHVDLLFLAVIVFFAIWLRLATANVDIILDYDPWFWFRHAQEILQNNFLPPKWDLLSYFPPGRPFDYQLGWSYTLAAFYALTNTVLTSLTFMEFSIYFIAVFSGLCAIPAYFVGKMITNKWGGLITAFFAVITPTFLGVSMAGYPDSDAVDVFYTFIAILTTLYAIKSFSGFKSKKTWGSIALALASYWLFAFNWNTSWYIFYIFVAFIPFFIVFKIIESLVQRQEKTGFMNIIVSKIKESKNIIFVIVLIGILGEIVALLSSGWPTNTIPPIEQLLNGLNFLSGRALIVDISVAELQTVNVFSRDGFLSVASRVGMFPVILAIVGLPVIFVYKLFYKKSIKTAEYFAIIWLIISFWLITRGIRFSLLFSMAVATAAGFVVGSLVDFLKSRKEMLFLSLVYGIILFGLVWHISDNIIVSKQAGGMEVDQNWRAALDWLKTNSDQNTLITTWWDPGHIIAGYSGLKVMADGAHCADSCYPYNHNIRIQDMGRVFSLSNETEAINILQKYTGLNSQQCQELKQKFGDAVSPKACDKVTEMYVIASSDLIGKYTWLNYFGGFKATANSPGSCYVEPAQTWVWCYWQMNFYNLDQSGNPTYGDGSLTLALKNNTLYPIWANKYVVGEIVYFNQGNILYHNFANNTNLQIIDGMLWVDPTFQVAMYMPPAVRDSLFTRMFFFDGQGLSHFTQVYQNSELKIYKVIF
jgi:dolichyl-diphosphooligosaccharide--protein glycosyltransferase